MPILNTPNLIIRHIKEADLITLLAIYNKQANMRYISDGKSDWTMKELAHKYQIANKEADLGIGIFAIEARNSNVVIGEIGLFNSFADLQKLELGYIVDAAHCGKGFGKEVCEAIITYAFEELKATSLIARMYANNVASVKLSEHCGMHKIDEGNTESGDLFFVYQKVRPVG